MNILNPKDVKDLMNNYLDFQRPLNHTLTKSLISGLISHGGDYWAQRLSIPHFMWRSSTLYTSFHCFSSIYLFIYLFMHAMCYLTWLKLVTLRWLKLYLFFLFIPACHVLFFISNCHGWDLKFYVWTIITMKIYCCMTLIYY